LAPSVPDTYDRHSPFLIADLEDDGNASFKTYRPLIAFNSRAPLSSMGCDGKFMAKVLQPANVLVG
jgi:hypothetical protein